MTVYNVVCPWEMFCSVWMCCLEKEYNKVCDCVVNVYLDHLKFCVVCIDGRRFVFNLQIQSFIFDI